MKQIIIDVDVGTDDFASILYLLKAEEQGEVKILGIVCTRGNTELKNVVNNVVRLLEIEKRTDIPVFKGSVNYLLRQKFEAMRYHGEDGLGDLNHDTEPDLSIVNETPAAIAINEIIKSRPNEVSIICLGPLTNLALAIRLNDDLNGLLKDVWLMGGNYTACGNATCAAEFNFYADPEAAYITLHSLRCPIYILPWETTLIPNISLEWRLNVLGDSTPALRLLTKAEKVIFDKHKVNHWNPCDLFLAVCFVKPNECIMESNIHHASIELQGSLTRGQVVLDHLKENSPNVTIIEKVNVDAFKQELLKIKQ